MQGVGLFWDLGLGFRVKGLEVKDLGLVQGGGFGNSVLEYRPLLLYKGVPK